MAGRGHRRLYSDLNFKRSPLTSSFRGNSTKRATMLKQTAVENTNKPIKGKFLLTGYIRPQLNNIRNSSMKRSPSVVIDKPHNL